MELWGIEPQASWMQIKRSTNWATTPVKDYDDSEKKLALELNNRRIKEIEES